MMTLSQSSIKWSGVLLGVAIAFVIAYGSSIVAVTGYATYLSVLARGAPDIALINEFAARTAAGVTSIFIGVGTLVGGLRAGRKAKADAFQHGLLVGLITAFIDVTLSVIGGLSGWGIVSFLLAIAGGWLAGKLASK